MKYRVLIQTDYDKYSVKSYTVEACNKEQASILANQKAKAAGFDNPVYIEAFKA